MASPADETRFKNIRLKTQDLRRFTKQRIYWETGVERQQQRLAKLKDGGGDENEIKAEEEMAKVIDTKLLETSLNLASAFEELQKLLGSIKDFSEHQIYKDAQSALDAAEKSLISHKDTDEPTRRARMRNAAVVRKPISPTAAATSEDAPATRFKIVKQTREPMAKAVVVNVAAADEQFRPIVVTGPSGGGKTTLLNRLFKEYRGLFAVCIKHTTRVPRTRLTPEKGYYFVTKEDMRKDIEEGKFLEYAEFSGHIYGTSKQAVKDIQATGRICVLEVEIQNVRSIRKTDLNPRCILIKPPSIDVLERRLRDRQTEAEYTLKKKLDQAMLDMKQAENEPDLFDHVIVNDDLEGAYRNFVKILEKDLSLYRQRGKG